MMMEIVVKPLIVDCTPVFNVIRIRSLWRNVVLRADAWRSKWCFVCYVRRLKAFVYLQYYC